MIAAYCNSLLEVMGQKKEYGSKEVVEGERGKRVVEAVRVLKEKSHVSIDY